VRALRDRLPLEEASHLGAQLPLLIRGVYYDQWQPEVQPTRERHQEEFLARVADELTDVRPVNVKDAVQAVFKVLARHIAEGQARKVAGALPAEIRALWPSPDEAAASLSETGESKPAGP